MLTQLIAWFTGEVVTVEHIMSDFTNKVRQLEYHTADKLAEALHLEEMKEQITADIAFAKAEAAKAESVAAKIKELLA